MRDDVLDEERVEQLSRLGEGSGQDLVGQLAEMFFRDGPDRLLRLRVAVAAGSTLEVSRLAHSLKGSASNLGALALAECCRRLEEEARRCDLAACAERLPELGREFDRVGAALAAMRPKAPGSPDGSL